MHDSVESGNVLRRAQIFWRENPWFRLLVILAIWFVVWLIGVAGFLDHFKRENKEENLLHAFYLSWQLFILESGSIGGYKGWVLELARFLAPFVTFSTAIAAAYTIFSVAFLHFAGDHVVICGLGRIGLLLARAYRGMKMKVVLIEKDEGNPNIQQARDMRATVLIGEAVDIRMLRRARVHTARHLIACSGDDGINAEIAVQARNLVRNRKKGVLTCFAHITERQLFDLLNQHTIMKKGGIRQFRLCLFNIHDSGAREMLNEHSFFDKNAAEPTHNPRIVILGLGQFGQNVVAHAATMWKLQGPGNTGWVRIEAVDREAGRLVKKIRRRCPFVDKVCALRARELDFESSEFERADFLFDSKGRLDVDAIYVCIDDDRLGLSAALTLLNRIHALVTDVQVPIVVRTAQDRGLTELLSEPKEDEFRNLHPFELMERTCRPDLLGGIVEDLAIEFHKRYVKQQEELGESVGTNPSMIEWELLPEILKLANRRQASSVGPILREVGYEIERLGDLDEEPHSFNEAEIEKIAMSEHIRWVTHQLHDGWRLGRPKDPDRRIHPNLVPWDQISERSRDIDREWVRWLPSALRNIGYRLVPRH